MTSVVVLVPRARSGRKSKMETNEASAIKKTKPKAANSKHNGGKYCAARGPDNIGCKNNSHTPGVSMHDFPKDEKTRKKWIDFVGRHQHGWKPNSDARTPPSLCSLHFEPTCFVFAGELVLWEPTHGRRGRGRPSATFIDTLKRDLGTDDKLELEVCMTNQEDWRARRAARLRPP